MVLINIPIKKMIVLNFIVSILVSPGLSVKIYLKKFININNWINKIVKNNGSCDFIEFVRIKTREIAKDRKIIPITSLNPAIAWLNAPRLFNANSSVKTRSWNE